MASNERPWKWLNEERRISFDMRPKLDDDELVATDPAPTVTEVGTSDLAISDVQVNTVAVVIDGRPVPPGQAIQAMVAGGNVPAGETKRYQLLAKCNTNSTPAQTLEQPTPLDVRAK